MFLEQVEFLKVKSVYGTLVSPQFLQILAILCVAVYVPLCMIRKIEKLSWSHLLADVLILITFVVILVYTTIELTKNNGKIGENV